jgi:hypothetical protein
MPSPYLSGSAFYVVLSMTEVRNEAKEILKKTGQGKTRRQDQTTRKDTTKMTRQDAARIRQGDKIYFCNILFFLRLLFSIILDHHKKRHKTRRQDHNYNTRRQDHISTFSSKKNQ